MMFGDLDIGQIREHLHLTNFVSTPICDENLWANLAIQRDNPVNSSHSGVSSQVPCSPF